MIAVSVSDQMGGQEKFGSFWHLAVYAPRACIATSSSTGGYYTQGTLLLGYTGMHVPELRQPEYSGKKLKLPAWHYKRAPSSELLEK